VASNGLDPLRRHHARNGRAVSPEERARRDAQDRQVVEEAARLVIALGVVMLLLGFHLSKLF
jgi:hypothetical protein